MITVVFGDDCKAPLRWQDPSWPYSMTFGFKTTVMDGFYVSVRNNYFCRRVQSTYSSILYVFLPCLSTNLFLEGLLVVRKF